MIIDNYDIKANEILINEDAEKTVLGTFIINPETQDLIDVLSENIFTSTQKSVFKAFKNARQKTNEITIVELQQEMKKINPDFEITSLTNLASYGALSYQLPKYIKVLNDLEVKRKIFEYLKKGLGDLLESVETDFLIYDLSNKLEGLKTNTEDDNENIQSIIQKSMNRLENTEKGIKYGYSLLDDNIGGIKESEYTIIGAKSGVGKTTLAMNIVLNVIEQDKKVLYISREMAAVDVIDRFITMLSGIPTIKFKNKDFSEDDWRAYVSASNVLAAYEDNLIIDNDSSKISQITRKVREIKPDLVVIDYIQLLQSEDGARNENAEQRISNISRAIRDMTLKYGCHVMGLVQLNNSYKGLPTGENVIRQSAVVYQDATAVIYLHEPTEKAEIMRLCNIDEKAAADILRTNEEKKDISVYAFKLDKNRNGATDTQPITFFRPRFKLIENKKIRRGEGVK